MYSFLSPGKTKAAPLGQGGTVQDMDQCSVLEAVNWRLTVELSDGSKETIQGNARFHTSIMIPAGAEVLKAEWEEGSRWISAASRPHDGNRHPTYTAS